MTQEASPPRGLLEQFISKSILLAATYFLIATLYQQAYLRHLGLRVGLLNVSGLLPVLTDVNVVVYTFGIWALLTRLPERWYSHLAELANPRTWHPLTPTPWLRLSGMLIVWGLMVITGVVELLRTGRAFQWYEPLVPTGASFARIETVTLFLLLWCALAVLYVRYSRLRRRGLEATLRRNRRSMRVMYEVAGTCAFAAFVFAFGLTFPSFYGASKARMDMRRMAGQPLMRVERLTSRHAPCSDAISQAGSDAEAPTYHYVYQRSRTELHYLGTLMGQHLFILFDAHPDSGEAQPERFRACLASVDNVYSMKLDRPE